MGALLMAQPGFGLVRVPEEGAPMHPDDLTWECDLSNCKKCKAKYDRQLKAWEAHESRKLNGT